MKREQDAADAAVAPALRLWSRLIQAAAAVVILLSLTLMLAPRIGETIFNLVYFHQLSIPVEAPSLALDHIWFANGIIGTVTASWFLIDTAFSIAHGVWGNVLLNTATGLIFGDPLLFSHRHFIAKH